MIRLCGNLGCTTLTLGPLCLACEQKEAKAAPKFTNGRPYVPAVRPAAAPTPGEGETFQRSSASSALREPPLLLGTSSRSNAQTTLGSDGSRLSSAERPGSCQR